MHSVLNGNIEIIKFLFGDIDEERNKKIGNIFNEWKNEKQNSLVVKEKAVVLNAPFC